MTRTRAKAFIFAGLAATFVATLGTTMTDLGPWYRSLRQPDWAPPDPVYGAAWTLIFALAAASGSYAWLAAPSARVRETLIGLFAFNGFLNVAWSLIFFRLRRPDWALIEVVLLWGSIAALILYCSRFSRRSAWLLAPYIVWVTIAAALNWEVVRLNPAFG